jgi:D-sedoheptulose 7-phosphate isomerase
VTGFMEIGPPQVNGLYRTQVPASDARCVAGPVTRHTAAHLSEVTDVDLDACADELRAAVIRGAYIYTFGNGGSASTASHLACDMSHRRQPLHGRWARVRCLGDLATTTAIGNDRGYDQIFAAQLRSWLDERDVLVAISVSGASANVVHGLKVGRERGATNVALLGCDGGAALPLCDAVLRVSCNNPGVVESVHLAVVHELAVRVHATGEATDPVVVSDRQRR